MLELGVIADDLTGGMMVASLLEREGVRCPLVTSVDALNTLDDDTQAVVVGRKLLIQPPDDARADAKHTAEALLAKGTKQIYYKYSALYSTWQYRACGRNVDGLDPGRPRIFLSHLEKHNHLSRAVVSRRDHVARITPAQ